MRSLFSLSSLVVAKDVSLHPSVKSLAPSLQAKVLREVLRFCSGELDASFLRFCESKTLVLPAPILNSEFLNELSTLPIETESLSLSEADVSVNSCRRFAASIAESLSSLNLSQSLRGGLLNAFSKCLLLRSIKCDDSPHVRDREVQVILSRCELLQELSLRRCRQLTDRAFAKMKRCYLLRLDVREVRALTDVSLSRISQCCPTLLALSLEGQRVLGHGIRDVLDYCTELEALALPLVAIDEPKSLLRVRNTAVKVKHLDLFGSLLPEDTLLFLFGNVFRNLRKLNVSGVRNLTFDAFKYAVQRSALLESLSLKGHIVRVDDTFLEVIGQNLKCLSSLDLSLCRAISNDGLLRLFSRLPVAMKCVNLISMPVLTDDVVKIICEKSGARLEVSKKKGGGAICWFFFCFLICFSKKLSLGGNHLVSNEGARFIAQHCDGLRSLCLKGCNVDDSSVLMDIVSRNPRLVMLSLSGLKAATDEVVSCIARECADIHEIFLSGVPVSNTAVSKFKHVTGYGVNVYGKRIKMKQP